MRIFFFFLFTIHFIFFRNGMVAFAQNDNVPRYSRNTVIFKIKPQFSRSCSKNSIAVPTVNNLLKSIPVTSLSQLFPGHLPPPRLRNYSGRQYVNLSLIYELKYDEATDVHKVMMALMATGAVDYAQPRYIAAPLYVPDDPSLSSQYYLTKINALSAWDISTGSNSVVIGLTDTGTDNDHPDLGVNLKLNYSDPVNGIDDDFDGFTDNFYGWDLGDMDNDPEVDGTSGWLGHGSFMAGLISAVTDNGVGIASAGFYCMYLPVKVSSSAGDFSMGYEGIVYAADHGCQIINCSWGDNVQTPFGQDVINYATINKNALVVAAAGNSGDEAPFYPASNHYVLSVAGTDQDDIRYYASSTNSSSFGIYVDVSAPGKDIYSTYFDDNYIAGSGTSCSAAIISSCAGLVRAYRPWLTAMQVNYQLKVTADNIDTIPGNANYAGKLGSGRINLFKALNDTFFPAIALVDNIIKDNNDEFFIPGDTLYFTGTFINYLAPANSVNVSITSQSASLEFPVSSVNLGPLSTMESKNNLSEPMKIFIGNGIPYNSMAVIKILYAADTFSNYEYVQVPVNLDYRDISVNAIHATITSKGRIGYNDTLQFSGSGFRFKNSATLLYEAGFMVGDSAISVRVSDNIRGNSGYDNDFRRVTALTPPQTPFESDYDLVCTFNDDNAWSNKLGLGIKQKTMAWKTPADSNYIILEYTITNEGTSSRDSLYAGIFSDWDIDIPFYNRAGFDQQNKTGYVYSSLPGNPYGGIKLLSSAGVFHYSMDNVLGGNGGIDPATNGFSSAEKYKAMQRNRHTAGSSGTGSDILSVVSAGPFQLLPGDSVRVAFAILAGDNLTELIAAAKSSQVRYDSLRVSVNNINEVVGQILVFPVPASDNIFISGFQNKNIKSIDVYSPHGLLLQTLNNVHCPANGYPMINIRNLEAGIYFCAMRTVRGTYFLKFIVLHQ
ncbi:MAG: S8 family serine peptidase [Bacteroidetes bacterium]|nr:S8 family serine peptidase [Bacteroidota bacterium]